MYSPHHVLRDEPPYVPLALQPRQRVVRRVGRRLLREPLPPDEGARPVAAAVGVVAHEVLVRHRLEPRGVRAVLAAVVRDGRLRGHAGARDDQQALGGGDEVSQRADLRRGGCGAFGGGGGRAAPAPARGGDG